MERYKVSVVNYLNSAPFVHGLKNVYNLNVDLHLDHPSESARKLESGEVDIALAPVAIIPRLNEAHIISDLCIGCDGPVRTVKLFSEVGIDSIKGIYLDYQSETSVLLTRILCGEYWMIQPEMIRAYPGFQKDIYGDHAGLIIGDRAIRALGRYNSEIDLGEQWKDWTGLPFVFAVWLSNKPLNPQWQMQFDSALKKGLAERKSIAARYRHLDSPLFSVEEYLSRDIDYDLDDRKREALALYLSKIAHC